MLKTLVGVFMAEPTTSLQITGPRWPAASASKRFCLSAVRKNIGMHKISSMWLRFILLRFVYSPSGPKRSVAYTDDATAELKRQRIAWGDVRAASTR